jgi:hypothetical protein
MFLPKGERQMKRLTVLLIVLMAVLAVPAWADTPSSQIMGSGGRSTANTPSSGLIGSGT